MTNANLPEIMTAADLQQYLHISRASAYNLLNSSGFPTLHVGSRLLVTRENFMEWMTQNTNHLT